MGVNSFNDLFDQEVSGYRSKNVYSNQIQKSEMLRARRLQMAQNTSVDLVDPLVDEVWGGYLPSGAPHNYFDYYFSGQDIRAYVDGTADDPDFSTLPIINMGFKIEQRKEPVYGFWSYTYDAVMRGTRLISGQMMFATKSPDYMRRLLTKAAQSRARAGAGVNYRNYRDLTNDDINIERFWGKNIDPAISGQGKHLFSVHPPFSLVIVYGIQNLSLNPSTFAKEQNDIWDSYRGDSALAHDINERLVDSDPQDNATRIVLEAIELVDCTTGYGPDGAVVTETYNFFARDMIVPARASGTTVSPIAFT